MSQVGPIQVGVNGSTSGAGNLLYYGDNLDILRRYVKDETVDLCYLDPPFNSDADYNVLFSEQDGSRSPAQVKAFKDTWGWDAEASHLYAQVVQAGGPVSQTLQAFRLLLGTSNMMAYLAMMAPRLVELHRVLKPTGSLFLHCDPTASHYLKLLLDAIFGARNFRNEIIWRRTTPKAVTTRRLTQNHDTVLSYQKSDAATWNVEESFLPYDHANIGEKTAEKYRARDEQGRSYQLTSLLSPASDRPNLTYEFLGVLRVWRWTRDRMQAAYDAGLVVQTAPGRVPRLKRYLDEQRGVPLGDVWIDINAVNSQAKERMGYPTQKPESLLERIIKASSNPGDVVLDSFCGCGTAITAAETLGRRWIGIDITHLAINLIKHRLKDQHGDKVQYRVIGEPVSLPDAAT
ncbi:MAG TPA: site-specific DNA-methyltransferase, partial [Chloroflexota bacterium]|nr:site-specific DNA-methyltransferase [Chloroflexota bacterium]